MDTGATQHDIEASLRRIMDALERSGTLACGGDVSALAADLLVEAITIVGSAHPATASGGPLAGDERDVLVAVGVDAEARPDPTPGCRGILDRVRLLSEGLSVAEAADHLGVNQSRVRQRLDERSLVGLRARDGRAWILPAFQFVGDGASGGELPGLAQVLRRIRRDCPPSAVAAFFETPQPDLESDEDRSLSPHDWLLAGGDPEIVAVLADAI